MLPNHERLKTNDPHMFQNKVNKKRRFFGEQVLYRLKYKEKRFYRCTADILLPPAYDRSNDGIFNRPDMYRPVARRLHGQAIFDPNLKDERNPLNYTPVRVLGYWETHDP